MPDTFLVDIHDEKGRFYRFIYKFFIAKLKKNIELYKKKQRE